MSEKKYIKYILFIVIIGLLLLIIRATYSRYVTLLSSSSYIDLGQWYISINDQDIIENSNFTNTIEPFSTSDSSFILSNVIAPSSTNSIELNMDFSKITIPFHYKITLVPDTSTIFNDYLLTSYSVNSTNYECNTALSDFSLEHTFQNKSDIQNHLVKFNFSWRDDYSEILNDALDTAISRNNLVVNYTVKISFEQLKEE